jgi:hypothetical protein
MGREACNLKEELLKSEALHPHTISGVWDDIKALGVVFSRINEGFLGHGKTVIYFSATQHPIEALYRLSILRKNPISQVF